MVAFLFTDKRKTALRLEVLFKATLPCTYNEPTRVSAEV
jgi:hypothetical protein